MGAEALRTVFAELGFNVDLKALEAANKAVDDAVKKARTLVGASAEVDKAEAKLSQERKKRATVDKTAPAPAAGEEARQARVRAEIADAQAKNKAPALAFKAPDAPSLGGRSKEWEAAKTPVTGLLDLVGRFEAKAQSAFGQKLPAAVQTFMGKLGIARTDFATMARVAGAATLAVVGVLHRATTAAFDFAAAFTADAEALRETAREARVTSSELQALQHAGAASGVGTERVTRSITAFGNKLRDANNRMAGGSGVSSTLRRLGISMRDASGQVRPTVDLLDEVAVAMEHISSPRRRIRVAESLGLDRRMLDILHTGAGGIRALREEMAELGGGVSPEATEAARRYAQAQERLRIATTSVRSVLFVALAPALQWVIDKSSKLAGWFARMTRGTHVFRIALIGLGAVAVAALAPAVASALAAAAPFIAAAAAVGLLVLALDDVIVTFQGGDSLLGRFLDRMGGVGTRTRFVRDMAEAWEGVELVLHDVADSFRSLWSSTQQLWQSLSSDMVGIFGGAWQSISAAFGQVWDGITARVQQFFSFVGRSLGAVARRLGITDVADALGGMASGAIGSAQGALGGLAARDDVQGLRRGLGLVEDLTNPLALVRNARDFYGGMATGVPAQQVVAPPTAIPATRTVSAGGGGGRSTVITQQQTLQLAPGAIQVTGMGDPRRAAEMVVEEINRRARAARDGQTPREGAR